MKRKQDKTLKKVISSQETIGIIEQQLKELKQKVKAAGKLKGQDRRNTVIKIQKVEIRNLSNLIMNLENTIYAHEQDQDFQTSEELSKKYDQFKNNFDKLRKELEFIRNEGRREEDIYQDRKGKQPNTKEQYAERIEKAQVQSEMAVKNMLRMLHQTKEIGNSVNVELERQIEALDDVNQNLQQTQSTMNRALRHINYFARSVYTDKLLMVLLILVVLAVVAIIILSAMGKVSGPTTDVLS